MSLEPGDAHVLVIVEDDRDLLEGWRELFEFSDYKVHAFTSARAVLADGEALRAADMLISDYHLADQNGIELIREVRRIRPGLPAVLLTGLREQHVRQQATEAGITLFYKPIAVGAIEAHVRAALVRSGT